jgi:hypothetical protein
MAKRVAGHGNICNMGLKLFGAMNLSNTSYIIIIMLSLEQERVAVASNAAAKRCLLRENKSNWLYLLQFRL